MPFPVCRGKGCSALPRWEPGPGPARCQCGERTVLRAGAKSRQETSDTFIHRFIHQCPPRSSRCLVFAFRASQEGDLGAAFGSSPLRPRPERPGPAPAHESPPAHASPGLTHPREHRPLHFGSPEKREPSGKSGEVSRSRRAAAAASRLPARVTARRTSCCCCPGTNGRGDTGREKRRERRSRRIQAAPGLNFCLLSERCARRGEAQPGPRREPFPGLDQLRADTARALHWYHRGTAGRHAAVALPKLPRLCCHLPF